MSEMKCPHCGVKCAGSDFAAFQDRHIDNCDGKTSEDLDREREERAEKEARETPIREAYDAADAKNMGSFIWPVIKDALDNDWGAAEIIQDLKTLREEASRVIEELEKIPE